MLSLDFVPSEVFDRMVATERQLMPLKNLEPMRRDEEGKWLGRCRDVRNWLKPFGMAIAPNLPKSARDEWLNAQLLALSDLPPDVTIQAAQEAIHQPMQFLNEVHGHVRDAAERIVAKLKSDLWRYQRMHDEIVGAARPEPALPPPPEPQRCTPDEIRGMSVEMRRIGLGCGALMQAEVDAAFAEIRDAA